MADLPGSIRATAVELEGDDNNIESTGTLNITASDVLIQDLHYPSTDGAAGQILSTNGEGILSWSTGNSTGANSLNDLLDVTVNTPVQDQVLQYDDTSGQWINTAFTIGTFGLDELSDVGIDTPLAAQSLVYNGTFWANYQLSVDDLSDVDTVTNPPQENNVLIFKTDTWVPGITTMPGDNVSTLTNDAGYISDITSASLGDLADVDITTTPPTNDQVLAWDGTNWVPKTDATTDISNKADKVTTVDTTNGFAGLSVDGNLTDSGSKASDFATATQGATADTATQPLDNISTLTNDSNFINAAGAPVQTVAGKTGAVTLVKADITDFSDGDYATAAQGATADTATQPLDNISTLTNDAAYISDITAESIGDLSDVDIATVPPERQQILSYDTDTTFKPEYRMNWRNRWIDTTYYTGDVVVDGEWTMVANQTTTDRAAPYATGPAAFMLPDLPVWTSLSNFSTVSSGHMYVFNQGGWLTELRVWAPETGNDVTIRAAVINLRDPANPVVNVVPTGGVVAGQWTTIAYENVVLSESSVLKVILETLNSGSNTLVTGGWLAEGDGGGNGSPDLQGWDRNKNTELRISKEDLDGTDRSSELLGVVINSTIRTTQTSNTSVYSEFLVTADPTDEGTYVNYAVTRTVNNGDVPAGQATTIDISIPIPQATSYVVLPGGATTNQPDYATVTGILEYDGVDQAGNETNAFGVDIKFTPGQIADGWDYMTSSNIAVSDGVSEGSSSSLDTLYPVANPVSTIQRPNNVATGTMVLDIDLGLPIWWNGANWVNAMGTIV